MSSQGTGEPSQAAGSGALTWLACLIALEASVGSVYLSVGMGLNACPLCFYQRTFAFAAFGVLLVGLLIGAQRSGLSLLALPLSEKVTLVKLPETAPMPEKSVTSPTITRSLRISVPAGDVLGLVTVSV